MTALENILLLAGISLPGVAVLAFYLGRLYQARSFHPERIVERRRKERRKPQSPGAWRDSRGWDSRHGERRAEP